MNIATILAIICVTALAIIGTANGLNGALLVGSSTIIAGLGGYAIKRKVEKK